MSVKTDLELIADATVIATETMPGANNADRVGQMFTDIVESKVNIDSPVVATAPTKIYVALASQSGSADPVVTELVSTFDNAISFDRPGTGVYDIFSAGEFPIGKTLLFLNNGFFGGLEIRGSRQNDSQITFTTINAAGAAADSLLDDCSIKIEVYS